MHEFEILWELAVIFAVGVVVDLNPENVARAERAGTRACYCDVSNAEILEHMGAGHARELVLVINDPEAAERSIKTARPPRRRIKQSVIRTGRGSQRAISKSFIHRSPFGSQGRASAAAAAVSPVLPLAQQ